MENFKGYHDSVGKDPAQLVRALELVGIRSPNAYSVFENCYNRLQKTRDQTEWQEFERNRDKRLRNKGRFGMDTRTVWFVVETKADQERLSVKYPGRILLCDRSFVLDTHAKKAVDDTTRLHEFRSTAMRVPDQHPITWQAGSSRLPCNCPRCLQNPNNSLCHVSPWRKPQTVTMQIACPPPAVAEKLWIGEQVAIEKGKQLTIGTVLAFSPLNNTWSVDIGESLTVHLPYFDLCKWKKRFDNIAAEGMLQWISKLVVVQEENRTRYGTILAFSPADKKWVIQFGDGTIGRLSHIELVKAKKAIDGMASRFCAKLRRNKVKREKGMRLKCRPESET